MAVTYNDSGQGNTIGSNDRGVLYTNYTADGPQIQFMDHAGNLVNTFADKTSARNFLDSELTFDAYNQQAAEMENLSVGQSPFGMATTMAMGEENGGFAGTGPNGPLTGPGANNMAFTNDELYGVANPLNAENLLQMIVGNTEQDLRFDVNQDGEISIGDVTPLLRHKQGLETDNEFINNFNQQYQQANAGGIVPAPPAGVTQGQLGQANPLTAQPLPDGGNSMLPQVLPGAGVANTRAIGEDNSMLQPIKEIDQHNPNAFTRAIGEDGNFGGAIATTTQAIGEDGNFGPFGPPTTMAVGEEGDMPSPPPGGGMITTQAMGEEEGQPGFPGQPTPPDMHPPGLFQQPQPRPPMPLPGGNGKGGGGFQQPPAYQRPPNPFMGGGFGGYGGGFGGFGGGFQPQPYQQPYQPRPMYQPQPYGGGFGGGGKGGGGGFQPQPFMPQQPYQQPYQPQQQPFMQQQPGGKGGGGGFGPQDQLFGMQNQQNAQNQQMFNMQNASPNGQQMQAQPAPAGTGGASPFGSMLGAAAGGGSGNRTALF